MRQWLWVFLLTAPLASWADDTPATITVLGEAVTKAIPDQANIPVTLTSEGASLSEAKQNNDAKLSTILALLQKYGVAKEEIDTSYNSVEPIYNYNTRVTQKKTIYVDNLTFSLSRIPSDKVDAIIRMFRKEGGNQISSGMYRSPGATNESNVNAFFEERDEDMNAVQEKVQKKKAELTALTLKEGIAKETISTHIMESHSTETESHETKPHIENYKATMTLMIRASNKDKATPLISALTSEADTIGDISFTLGNEKELKEKTLLDALQDADNKAHALAQKAGVSVDRVLAIDEGYATTAPLPRPFFRARQAMADAAEASAPPNLPSGTTEVRETITVTYQIK